jgi:uncharacterized membrane protein
MSDLIVIGYPDEQTAARVWDELARLQREDLVDLEDAAVIRRDRKGKLHVTTPAHHAVAWGTLSGLFWGTVIGLIFLFPVAAMMGAAGGLAGAGIGAGADLLIEEDFKKQVQDVLRPGTSAIVVVLRRAAPDRFLEALRPFGGTVLRTSLPPGSEQRLMKVLHGADPAAPTWEQPSDSAPASG